MDKSRFIPSMFHRRLVLLLAGFGVIVLVLSGQLFRLSVVEGSERLAAAEAMLDRRMFLPTTRGRVLDRHGRVLALDRASDDVAVEYDVITNNWPRTKAAEQARKDLGRSKWTSMGPEEREAAISARLAGWNAKCNRLWTEIRRLGKITDEELQRRLDAVKADVQSKAASVWEQQRRREHDLFGITEDEFKARPVLEQDQAHVILPHVSEEVAFEFRRLAQELPGMFEVATARQREYPWSSAEVSTSRSSLPRDVRSAEPMTIRVHGVADHILGSMRDEVWVTDTQRRPFRDPKTGTIDLGWYLPGDSVGARGLERVFEDHLRGLRGEIRARRNTGSETRTAPIPGRDLQLTIDVALQARIQAILSPELGLTRVQGWHNNPLLPLGTPLNSAAVVIEVETGEVLAMVSMPTIAMGELMGDAARVASQPMVNRPVEAVYPPGSIIKPLVLAAAVAEGLHNLSAPIVCNGQYFENQPDAGRCWIYRPKFGMATHGGLRAEEALGRSCNIFFYTLGDRLGLERLCAWLGNFGMGQRLDVGLLMAEPDGDKTGEGAGDVPSTAKIAAFRAKGDWKFNQVIMAIGQGPISWTPLHAANAFATLARGGTIRDATLISGKLADERPKRRADLNLSTAVVEAALEGLRQSVEEPHGTGNHINHEGGASEPIINAVGVKVSAKTGTAQAPPMRIDSNNDGKLDRSDQSIAHLDHSWFVGLVGERNAPRPLYAIAVIVEYGGSGGRCAGPVANQIIRALQSEGYLPGDASAPPPDGPAPSVGKVAPEHDHEGDD